MDFSDIDVVKAASEPSPMPFIHPHTGVETDVIFLVLGYDSEEVQAAGRKFARSLMARKKRPEMMEMQRQRTIALAKAAIVGLAPGSGPFQLRAEALFRLGILTEEPEDPKALVDITVPSKMFHQIMDLPGYITISQQTERHGDDRGNYSPEVSTD